MRMSVFRDDGLLWDVMVSRPKDPRIGMAPVWLVRYDRETRKESRVLLAQVCEIGKLGWTVVVAGDIDGRRLVDGFKTRWKAISYAIAVRADVPHGDSENERGVYGKGPNWS